MDAPSIAGDAKVSRQRVRSVPSTATWPGRLDEGAAVINKRV